MDSAGSDRPQRRTALVGRELDRYKVEIAALRLALQRKGYLRDFNARVGTDHQTWEGMIGTEWIGKCNSNGLLLLKKWAEHKLLITANSQQDIMDTSLLQTLVSHWLCHSTKEGQIGCQSDKDYVWCRLLDRSQACCQQTQPAHSACTATTRQESAKETGCL